MKPGAPEWTAIARSLRDFQPVLVRAFFLLAEWKWLCDERGISADHLLHEVRAAPSAPRPARGPATPRRSGRP